MLLAQKGEKKLEESIIQLLSSGGVLGPTLLENARQKDPTLSKETFYRVLRTLLSEEVINKHGAVYELNRHWLQRIYRFGKQQIETNLGIDSDGILSFKEGDKISYKFKNPNLMGIYWAHTYDMIFERHDPSIPILIFHPHEWLIHTRPEAESFFLQRFAEDKKLAFFSIGGATGLDKVFKNERENTYLQISIGTSLGLNKTEYINVLGDFIFKVTVSKKFSEDLEAFFKINEKVTPENRMELEKICERKDTAKMVFTRSKKEADKWRSKFKKYFYIPRKTQ